MASVDANTIFFSSKLESNVLFNCLVRWLAPSLVFTCEEAWKARGHTTSIHLEDFDVIDIHFDINYFYLSQFYSK